MKGEIKYSKLDKDNCIQVPLPFWSASETGSSRRLSAQSRLCNDQTTGAETRLGSNELE
jgi:hypothetical protein